jgi:two-component system nitrogen regulation response regulator NtrX
MTTHEHLSGAEIVGESPLMREVLGQIDKAAASRTGVLVTGEPGTGRGLVARAIHACANADGAPFVAVDGDTLLPGEAERQIFGMPGNGHGNDGRRAARAPEVVYPGSLLHSALGGTIFFRHLQELPTRVQARLATLFRDREFLQRSRGDALPFTARPMAAVDLDFQSHIDEGRVRLDLHRRFAEFRIALPPLRERREDIPALAQFFVTRACRERDAADKTLDSGAQAVLSAMPWHGNSRELRDLLDSLVQATPDCIITLQALLDHVSLDAPNGPHPALGASLREARMCFEREYIAAVVARHHGRIPDAAKSLGIQRTNLYRKLRTLRLAKPEVRHDGGRASLSRGARGL